MTLVRQSFRPEFLNRLDDIVMFQALTEDDLAQIVELTIDQLQQRLHERRLTLAVTPDARSWLAERGYDPVYGARPLRSLITTEVQNKLATALLSGRVRDGDTVRVDVAADGSELVLTERRAARCGHYVVEAELIDGVAAARPRFRQAQFFFRAAGAWELSVRGTSYLGACRQRLQWDVVPYRGALLRAAPLMVGVARSRAAARNASVAEWQTHGLRHK